MRNLGPYVRVEWEWNKQIELAGGFRFDSTHFNLEDAFLEDGDQSDSRTLSEWSGTLGSVYHMNQATHFYTNIASVFETPTTTELTKDSSGGSGFNPNLYSQK